MTASYSLARLTNGALLQSLNSLLANDRTNTAAILAHLAEVEARKLHVAAGYSSMFEYCTRELHMSEGAAYKRIRAARLARRFPALFVAVADGRLHLSALVLLKSEFTRENVDELIAAATHKAKAEIQRLIAERSPRPDVPTRLRALPSTTVQLSPGTVGEPVIQLSPGTVGGVGQVPAPDTRRAIMTPLAPRRFALQVTIDQEAHDLLKRAQELLSHQVPSGDVAEVLARALRALVSELEAKKFAATSRPRASRSQPAEGKRYIPSAVRRAVLERDGGQCSFVSESGHRCESRKFLEFDHVHEVARGGESTVDNIRLRCREHNQYAAEQTFGAGFMDTKRREARTDHGDVNRLASIPGVTASCPRSCP